MMQMPLPRQQILVSDPYDVIAMRQQVRQAARTLGLGLMQQAKITAAISAVARALLAIDTRLTVTIWCDREGPRPSLQIACAAAGSPSNDEVVELERELSAGDAGTLVDEISVAPDNDQGALLTLRMWLAHA
jgi:hypothetical protein